MAALARQKLFCHGRSFHQHRLADIANGDDVSLIKFLIDEAVHDVQTMGVYAGCAWACKKANAAAHQ